MPQTMPMLWLAHMSFSFILMMMLTYFFYFTFYLSPLKNYPHNSNLKYWLWKW